MNPSETIKTIKEIWLKRLIKQFAKGNHLKSDLTDQFLLYFNLMEQSLETGEAGWFDSLMDNWSTSLTQSDLEGNENSLTEFVKQIISITHQVCLEQLDPENAVILLTDLLPISLYVLEKAAQYETEAKISYITRQLDQVRLSMEKLDRSKSGFIAVAAHELKTPLTLVDGYTSMLSDTVCFDENNVQHRAYIKGIQNGTKRLRAIIDDMIDVSLIDNNLMSLNFQPFWINRLMDVLLIEMKPSIDERNITIKIQDFEGYKELNFGDPERLLQVLRNLVMNAVKYTPDGGEIEFYGRKLPGFVEVCVHDTGIGIDSEDQALIFEKFSRIGNVSLHSSGKTKFKGGGPGLGLHIAKGIIEAHGGTIWVESPGYDENTCPGSTFHLLLPTRETPPDDKTAKLFEDLKAKG
jgi:signal transduction histidine kinase